MDSLCLVATHLLMMFLWFGENLPEDSNYYLYDFEVDNGGWVSSGYGDWNGAIPQCS